MTDAERTRARILEAAKQEFAAEGFAGARVDSIARLAGSNKQLIYHYFKDKEGLFRAVMLDVLSDRPPLDFRTRADFSAQITHFFEDMPKKRLWMRLLMWEALASEERPVVGEEERLRNSARVREDFEQLRKIGVVDPGIPMPHFMLALMALALFPWVFPQITRHLTGQNPSEPEFRRCYGETIRAILRRLGPA